MHGRLIALVGIGALIVSLSLGPPGSLAGPAVSRLVIAQTVDHVTLDMYFNPAVPTQNVSFSIMEPLVAMDRTLGKLEYKLATAITPVDALIWEVKLRPGVRWHDGQRFTATDVKYTFDRMSDAARKLRHVVPSDIFKGVDVVDDLTVRIRLEKPYAPLARRLIEFPMVPRHVIEAVGDEKFGEAPVGTGPYRFARWVKGEFVELAANRDYWGPKPAYDVAIFRAVPEATTRVASLLSGSVDIATDIPPELANAVRTRGTLRLEPVQGMRVMYVGMNTHRKPLDNVKVRQALNFAIDKQALVEKAMSGYAVRNIGILSPRSFGYNPKVADRYPYDVARARQLLAEAGVTGGFDVSFDLGRRYFRDREVAQAIAGYLGAVGVRVQINEMEWGTFVVNWSAGKTEGFWYHGFADMTGDADLPLYYFFSPAGQLWRAYFSDQQIADLVDRGRTTLDPKARTAAYEQALERIVDVAPMIWLFSLNNAYGVSNAVDWTPRPDERILPYEAKPMR